MGGIDPATTAEADQICAAMFETIAKMAAEVRACMGTGVSRDQMAITGAAMIRERYAATPEQAAVIASFALVRLAELPPGGGQP